jgi:hypothetical protein
VECWKVSWRPLDVIQPRAFDAATCIQVRVKPGFRNGGESFECHVLGESCHRRCSHQKSKGVPPGYAGGVEADSPGCEATPGLGDSRSHLPRQGVADCRIFAPLRGADSQSTRHSPGACFARPGAIGCNASGVETSGIGHPPPRGGTRP